MSASRGLSLSFTAFSEERTKLWSLALDYLHRVHSLQWSVSDLATIYVDVQKGDWYRTFLEQGRQWANAFRQHGDWVSMWQSVNIGTNQFNVEIFLHPVQSAKSGLSIKFEHQVYDAISGLGWSRGEKPDQQLQYGLCKFCSGLSASISAEGFIVDFDNGLLREVSRNEVTACLYGDSSKTPGCLIGIRENLIERKMVTRAWGHDSIFADQNYIILNLMGQVAVKGKKP